jgi:hypothetical protein
MFFAPDAGKGQHDQLLLASSPIPQRLVGLRSAEHTQGFVQAGRYGSLPDLRGLAGAGGVWRPRSGMGRIVLVTHDKKFQQPTIVANDPQSGADDPFGLLRVIFRIPALVELDPNGSNKFWAASGDGYVQLVEFTKEGANASALLGYGNASRPFSAHVADQLEFFEKKMLRPTFRTRAEVESHLGFPFRETCCN